MEAKLSRMQKAILQELEYFKHGTIMKFIAYRIAEQLGNDSKKTWKTNPGLMYHPKKERILTSAYRASFSRSISRLEQRGLIHKNRRIVWLTDKGKEVINQLEEEAK